MLPPHPARSSSRGVATRGALLAAAVQIFGRDGFHAATTRAIADAANVRQALIGYHFRGKEGLYLAVFEHITDQIRAHLGPMADGIEKALDAPRARLGQDDRRALHVDLLLRMVENATALLVGDEATLWAQLILRELLQVGFNLINAPDDGPKLFDLTLVPGPEYFLKQSNHDNL